MPKHQPSGSFRMTISQHELCGNLIDGDWQYDSTIWDDEIDEEYDGYPPEVVIAAFVRRASAETTPTKKED